MRKIAMVDVDGVLLDYNKQYAKGWLKSFGEQLEVVDPNAYWAQHVYGARELSPTEVVKWREGQDYEHWSTMEPMPGASRLLSRLVNSDYHVIACTALDMKWHDARHDNLEREFPGLIEAMICAQDQSKSIFVNAINADIFIDDYAQYFYNVSDKTKKILVNRSPLDRTGPNYKEPISNYHQVVTHIDQIRID